MLSTSKPEITSNIRAGLSFSLHHSWAMCGGGPHYPETSGKPKYDPARTTWTVPVKLKPDWSCEFWLNLGKFDAVRSAGGVPVDSVHVTFKTAAKPN